MKSYFPSILLALILLCNPESSLATGSWRLETIPVTEIKSGMTGTGKTVFQGEEIETFGVVVIDVVENFYPQEDLIIVRLTGAKVEHTGVVAGMSGSPIYIDGRLAGALALRFIDFQKEPIAGVTPIAAMMRTRDFEMERSVARPAVPQSGMHYLRAILLGAESDFWQMMLAPQLPAPQSRMAAQCIESPLIFSGFSQQTMAATAPLWSTLGFSPIMGGEAIRESGPGRALEAGSALSQVFVRGDFGMDMTGTVTAVDGDQVLAFGHYLFNLGAIQMPMARSRVLTTLPSLMGSSKLARSVEVIGSIRQDRLSGVFGQVGLMPAWIPVRVDLAAAGGSRTFHFDLADDPALRNLTPFFLRTALFQALVAGKLSAEPSTVRLHCEIELADGRHIQVGDFISYQERLGFLGAGSELGEAVDLVAMTLGALTVNTFDSPPVRSIAVSAHIEAGERLAAVQAVRQDRLEVSPGDSLHLTMTLRRSSGEECKYTQCVCLPRYLQARKLTVLAGGADGLRQIELQNNPDRYRPDSFARLCTLLEQRRSSNNLYVQIREPAPGIAVDGEELTGLPPSILETMSGRGDERQLRDRVLAEWIIPTDCEVTGLKRLNVRITQSPKAKPETEQDFSDQLFLE
jgi:hypothetical protein